jgi:UDPglucose 6-dehydrogenase
MIGSWHQAIVYGATFAGLGHSVVGVCDSDDTARRLNAGEPVVFEPGLRMLLRRQIRARRLRYTTSIEQGLDRAAFAFISIDTPIGDDDAPNVRPVIEAARQIAAARRGDLTLCVTAQVPVGTSHRLFEIVTRGHSGRYRTALAYVPEFLRLGTAIASIRRADRIVVGSDDPQVARRVAALYAKLRRPVFITDVLTAEMSKHAANAFLATSISFINEVADLCERTGADAHGVAQIMKADRRIGPHAFLSPGLGFAGGTLGRDLRALQATGRELRVATRLPDAALEINAARARHVIERLTRELDTFSGRQIAFLGLAYKPGTSTLRRAIALDIAQRIRAAGARVVAFDPLAEGVNPALLERAASPYDAAHGADALMLLTEWTGLARLDWRRIARAMRGRLVVDTRGLLDAAALRAAGLRLLTLGRGTHDGRAA